MSDEELKKELLRKKLDKEKINNNVHNADKNNFFI